jgi:hypothetical protein
MRGQRKQNGSKTEAFHKYVPESAESVRKDIVTLPAERKRNGSKTEAPQKQK